MRRVSCALVGYGYWGHILHKKMMLLDEFVLRIICDTEASLFHDVSDVTFTTDLNDILNTPTITVVFVAVPPDVHSKIVLQCLSAGKHVWLEKPCGDSLNDYHQMHVLSQLVNRVLHLDFTYLYNPYIRYIFDKMEQLGVVPKAYQSIRMNENHLGAAEHSHLGLVQDLGVHDISIVSLLFPNVDPADWVLKQTFLEGQPITTLYSRCNELEIDIKLCWNYGMKVRDINIDTDRMSFKFYLNDMGKETLDIAYLDGAFEQITLNGPDAIERSMLCFLQKIVGLEAPFDDSIIGYRYHKVMAQLSRGNEHARNINSIE